MCDFMLMEQEFEESGEAVWYENDLQLAAELGKTLLERNKELEQQLKQSLIAQCEKGKELDLLTKQLDALRHVNESRMRLYEDVDKNQQELEKTNKKLRQDVKQEKDKNKQLLGQIEGVEKRCDDLQAKIDIMKEEARRRRTGERRTLSVPSLQDALSDMAVHKQAFGQHEFTGVKTAKDMIWFSPQSDPKEIRELKEVIHHMKEQLRCEQRRRQDAENEVRALVNEQEDMIARVTELEEERSKNRALECQLQDLEIRSAKLCKACGDRLATGNLKEQLAFAIEDDNQQEIPHGELLRLKNGGSAFGSRESLCNLGLEAEDEVPIQLPSNIVEMDIDSVKTPSREKAAQLVEDTSISILGEMEEQYKNLVAKYEALVEAKSKCNKCTDNQKCQTSSTNHEGKARQPELTKLEVEGVVLRRPKSLVVQEQQSHHRRLDVMSPHDPSEEHFNSNPEYKVLFKEIFQTLRRSVVYDDAGADVPHSSI